MSKVSPGTNTQAFHRPGDMTQGHTLGGKRSVDQTVIPPWRMKCKLSVRESTANAVHEKMQAWADIWASHVIARVLEYAAVSSQRLLTWPDK